MANDKDQPLPLGQLLDAMSGLDDLADLIENYPAHFTAHDWPALLQLQRTVKHLHDTHHGRRPHPGA